MSRLSEDLRVRTKAVASSVIRLYVDLPKNRREVEVLGHQLLKSGTSIAAHAREASRSRSDAEFCSKLDGLLQEADESLLWLKLLREDCNISSDLILKTHREISELIAIFVTMISKTRRNIYTSAG